MHAITVSEYGGSPSVTELPKPQPGPGQVLIAVRAAGMNPMDLSIANGAWKDLMPAAFPMVLGADLAGVVEDAAPGVLRFGRGDEVFGQLLIPPLGSAGTYAEYVTVVGGGSAGAAAGAAQAGARTLLLEAAGCVAGAATLKCVQTYCGLYTITGPVRPAVAGVAAQVIAELRRLGGVEGPVKFRGVFMLLDSEAVKYALDTVCENAGAEVLLHAQLMRADRDDALARSVTCHDHTVTVAAFVDATGECDLAWFAGASTRYGYHCFVNLGTLGTRFGGIAPDADLSEETWHAAIHAATIGRMVLDRNPENHFAEVEQSGFDPSNLVPGTGLSPDKMLMGRIFSCHDTHLHRIGPNYEQLPVNAPGSPVHSYNKDGPMAYRHAGSQPVYAPNSYGGPQADPDRAADLGWSVEAAEIGRYAYDKHTDDDFVQPRALYREVMTDTDKEHLVTNIASRVKAGVKPEVMPRVIEYWASVQP